MKFSSALCPKLPRILRIPLASLLLALVSRAEVTTVRVHPGQPRQTFDGMGCGAIFYEGHITSLAERGLVKEQERLFDDMFTQCRTDFLHLMIRPDHEPQNDNEDPYVPVFASSNFDYCVHDLAIAAAARRRNPRMQLYAALYTPPAWMKTNGNAGGGGKARGTLKPGLELELGEYLWAFVAHLQRGGQPIDYLSICNEPDWEHTQPGYFLTPEAHAALFARVTAYFRAMQQRYPEIRIPKLVAPNVLSAVDCAERYLPLTLSAAGADVDVVGSHDYDRRGTRWARLREMSGGRPLWVTEWCVNGPDDSPALIRSASEYWLAMTEAFNQGANVWMAYDWVYPPRQGGEALIHVDWGSGYTLTKIYQGFRQWCAPLQPGMRVLACEVGGADATGISMPGVKAAAFLGADGGRMVVQVASVQDRPAAVVLMPGVAFDGARVQLWRTSATEDVASLPDRVIEAGRIDLALPARSMCSIVLHRQASSPPASRADRP